MAPPIANVDDEISPTVPDQEDTPLLKSNGVPLVQEVSTARLTAILGAVWIGCFLAALDSTIVATLLGPISSSFNSFGSASWIASGYLISNSAFQPLSGRLTDIFGRRAGLVFSNVFFFAGTLMCGLAKKDWVMILGRVVAGAGGGGLNAIATFVASDLVPLRQRGVIQGGGNLVFGLGMGLGGLFGGYVNDTLGWRMAFLLQLPLIAISCIAIWFIVDIPIRNADESPFQRVDFLGSLTLVSTLVCLLVGLNSGGNTVPWNHPLIYVTLPLSFVLLLVFIYIEERWAKEPVIPVRLLLKRTVWSACLTNWFFTMCGFGLLYYGPIYFILTGATATQAGLRLIGYSVGVSAGSLISGTIMRWTGTYSALNIAVNTIFVAGAGILCSFDLNTPKVPQYLALVLIGFGYGGMLTVTLIALIGAVDHEYQAVVTSASYAFRATGSTLGVTFASAIFQNVLRKQLDARLLGQGKLAEEILKKVKNSLDEVSKVPEPFKGLVLESYMQAIHAVFWLALGFAGLAWFVALFIKSHKLYSTLDRNRNEDESGDAVHDE